MSNKAISVYAEAMKRQKEEEKTSPPSSGRREGRTPRGQEARAHVRTRSRAQPRTQARVKTRRTYDVFLDQAVALEELQLVRYKQDGRRPDLSEMVRAALDAFISRERRRPDLE